MTASVYTMEGVSKMVGLIQPKEKPSLMPKYVILEVAGVPTPVLFPAHLQHSDVGVGIDRMFTVSNPIISAGFYRTGIRYRDGDCEPEVYVTVFDGSMSLGVSSRPEDAEIIARLIN